MDSAVQKAIQEANETVRVIQWEKKQNGKLGILTEYFVSIAELQQQQSLSQKQLWRFSEFGVAACIYETKSFSVGFSFSEFYFFFFPS